MARRDLSISFDIVFGDWVEDFADHTNNIATASTAAMDEAVLQAKVQGRAEIGAAGFSRRWQNALRSQRYPKPPGVAMNPSGFIWHKIPYAGVFEDGASIAGSPYLWIPLPSTKARVGKDKMTPERFAKSVAPLVSLKSRRGDLMLGAAVLLSPGKAAQANPSVSLAKFRKGVATTTATGRARRGVVRVIPLFIGKKLTTIPKKINIREVCARARDNIPKFYAKYLSVE